MHKISTCALTLLAYLAIPTTYASQGLDTFIDNRKIIDDVTGTALVRGHHPRTEGIWWNYFGTDVALRSNISISDVITTDASFVNWRGEKVDTTAVNDLGLDSLTHNHYQNLLSEVINFKPGINAVAIWGDSAAVVNDARSWGGFLSARGPCLSNDSGSILRRNLPDTGIKNGCSDDFDVQLIGLEIDVLNGGKEGVYPNYSKTGLQIVGFGVPNSMAIEVRAQGTGRPDVPTRGQFANILYANDSIRKDIGRLITADFEEAKIGLDFRKALFREGLARVRTEGRGTGLVFNEYLGGQLFAGSRWPDTRESAQWLSLKAAEGGFRVESYDGSHEPLTIDQQGRIELRGDLFVNGRKITSTQQDGLLDRLWQASEGQAGGPNTSATEKNQDGYFLQWPNGLLTLGLIANLLLSLILIFRINRVKTATAG